MALAVSNVSGLMLGPNSESVFKNSRTRLVEKGDIRLSETARMGVAHDQYEVQTLAPDSVRA